MDEGIMYKRSQGLREYVASFHLLFMFLGLAITFIGAYFINSNISRTVSVLLLILGGMITITSFIGCFGAHLEHTGFLNTYSSITAIALILQLITMGLAYSHQAQLNDYGSKAWSFFHDNDPQFLLDLEQSVQCCGYESIKDRAVPATCSVTLGAEMACKERILANVQQWHQYITMAIVILLSIQLMALLVSVILSIIIDKETREEETYMALLSSQNNNYHHPWLQSYESTSSSNNGYFGRSSNPRTSQRSIPRYGSTPSTNKIYYST